MNQYKPFLKITGAVISLLILAGVFYLRAEQNLESTVAAKYSTNFFTLWGAGNMVTRGENPYDITQYLANHDRYGIEWRPNQLFPYPLPLALLLAPLGWLSLPMAFIAWQLITQIIIASVIFFLLNRWGTTAHKRLFAPLAIFMLFFGPVVLGMKTGSVSALALLFVFAAILLFERDRSFAAGMVLSLTLLKPPQGVTILMLAGIWFLARRDSKALAGIVGGGLGLFIVGLLQDPLWVSKFLGASEAVMNRTEGVHSNLWAVSYLICGGSYPCAPILGAALSLGALVLGAYFLWVNRERLSAWEVFNFILPVAFFSTVYLWSYDQTTYIIPIVWIVCMLVEQTKKYLLAFLFLLALDGFSIYATLQLSAIMTDFWAFGTTFIVLLTFLGLWNRKQRAGNFIVK